MKFSYAIVALLFAAPAVFALNVDLSITKIFTVDATYFAYNDSGLGHFDLELFNSGSLPYIAQIRIDIYNSTDRVFTAWSDKRQMAPGSHEPFREYWSPASSGQYTARLRAYYGGEILEQEMNFTASALSGADEFNITETKAYGNLVKFDIASPKDAGMAIIIPQAPQGWVFTQGALNSSTASSAWIFYQAPANVPASINVVIASTDGRYVSQRTVQIKRETGLSAMIIDMISGMLGRV